jgi:hypothetical protein
MVLLLLYAYCYRYEQYSSCVAVMCPEVPDVVERSATAHADFSVSHYIDNDFFARICSTDQLVFCAERFYEFVETQERPNNTDPCNNIIKLSSVKDPLLKLCLKATFICAEANQGGIMVVPEWAFAVYGVSLSRSYADGSREMFIRYMTPLKWSQGHGIIMDDA